MRYRLTQNDVSNQINVESVDAVNGAVRRIYRDLYPTASPDLLDHVFADFKRLIDGSERVNYSSPEDLLSKTPVFHAKVAHHRLHKDFHGVEKFAQAHFDGHELYGEAIRRNIDHLNQILEQDDFDLLRRQSCTLSSAAAA
ncbi:MAG: hypothetical protein O2845_06405 [Proteobacteria bacterium]|nr:hypothetical protein [Pseudomonadota bacterium]